MYTVAYTVPINGIAGTMPNTLRTNSQGCYCYATGIEAQGLWLGDPIVSIRGGRSDER